MEETMNIVKMIGMILLAVFLILTGLAEMSEVALAPMAKNVLDLLAIAAGVLILVSIGRFFPHKK